MSVQTHGREITLHQDAALRFTASAWNSFVRTLLQVSGENHSLSNDPRLALTQVLSSELWALEEGNNLLLVTRYFVLPCTLKEQQGGYCLVVHSCRPITDGDAVSAFREGALVRAQWVVLMPEDKAVEGLGAVDLYRRFFPTEEECPVPPVPSAGPSVSARPQPAKPAAESSAVPLPAPAPSPAPALKAAVAPGVSTPAEPEVLSQVPTPASGLKAQESASEGYTVGSSADSRSAAAEGVKATEAPAASEIEPPAAARVEVVPEVESPAASDSRLVSFKVSGGYTLEGALPHDAVDQLLKKTSGFQPKGPVEPVAPALPQIDAEVISSRLGTAPAPSAPAGRIASWTESTGGVSLSQGSIDALIASVQVKGATAAGESRLPSTPNAAAEPLSAAIASRRVVEAASAGRIVETQTHTVQMSTPAQTPERATAVASPRVATVGIASRGPAKADEGDDQMTQAQIDALLKQLTNS